MTSGNASLEVQLISGLICPSDDGNPYLQNTGIYEIKPGSGMKGAKTCYDFSVIATEYSTFNYWSICPVASRRMFGANSACKIAMVRDGTSNTVAIAERTLEVWDGSAAAWGYRGNAMIGVDLGFTGVPYGPNRWDRWYTSAGTPVPGRLGEFFGWGGLHPGGAHVLMGDGSARFASETTDLLIFRALATMAGSETNTQF